MTDRPLPLDGVVVLDLGQVYQGPYAGFLLAMAGARVIKIEPLGGETLRARGPSLPYAMLNSGKETVALDLKSEPGVRALRRLAAAADVVLTNFAPGVPERLGIGWDDLRPLNPRLIYGYGTGFGLDDPGAGDAVPAMDITVQAHMGIMSVTGHPGGAPVKAGVPFIDFLSGTHLYAALVTALYERERTGVGRAVEVAMVDAAYPTLASAAGSWLQTGTVPRTGNKHTALAVAPYDAYPCRDGYVALIAATNRHWRSVLSVIGRDDLVDDPRYRQMVDRAGRMDEVDALVAGWTRTRSRAEVAEALQSAHVPAAVVRNVEEVIADPDLHRRGAVAWIDHPELGRVPVHHSALRWRGSPLRPLEPSRAIGADTEAVLTELAGYTPVELAELPPPRPPA
ncbi:MAG: CaiB/BaiF CoA transferase family protein [Acidimicrobiales bacterium]